MNMDRARARRSGGNRSPMREFAAGAQLASPTPTPSRITNNEAGLQANPDSEVRKLHRVAPAARMVFLRPTSAQ